MSVRAYETPAVKLARRLVQVIPEDVPTGEVVAALGIALASVAADSDCADFDLLLWKLRDTYREFRNFKQQRNAGA